KIITRSKKTGTSNPYPLGQRFGNCVAEHGIFQPRIGHIVEPVSVRVADVRPVLIRSVKWPGIGCTRIFRCPVVGSHPTIHILTNPPVSTDARTEILTLPL